MTNKHIVHQVINAFIAGDIEKALSFITDDVQMEWPGAFALQPGKEAIRMFFETMPEILESSIGELIEDGNKVAGTGSLLTKFPDGAVRRNYFCDVYTFENGKVRLISSYMVFENTHDE